MSSAEIPPEILRDDSKRRELRTLFITMMTLPTVVVLIRTWSRALLPAFHMSKIPNKFWWDDWTVYIALALNIATCGMCLKLLDLGLGFHRQVVPQGVEPFLKLFWALYYVFDTGTAVSKASALFFYARLFGIANTRFKHALWVVHAMNGIWLVGVLLRALFMCSPIEKAWKSELPGHCNNTSVSWLGSVISSLVIDIIILVLPLPILWNLHMKAVRKIQITGVFVCGYLVVVVSIGRLVTIAEAADSDNLEKDPTFTAATPVLWMGSEIAISIISVSLPSVFFLLRRIYHQGFGSLLHTRTESSKPKTSSRRHPFHEEDGDELVSRSFDSVNKYQGNIPPGNPNPYPTQTTTTAQFSETNDSIEHTQQLGIHVRHEVSVE